MRDGKIYCFDIDGVVCTQRPGDYQNAEPYMDRIKKINELHKKHIIIFYTSRGAVTGVNWGKVTRKQFKQWGLQFDDLLFGKPFYDVFIDDKAVSDKDFFQDGK